MLLLIQLSPIHQMLKSVLVQTGQASVPSRVIFRLIRIGSFVCCLPLLVRPFSSCLRRLFTTCLESMVNLMTSEKQLFVQGRILQYLSHHPEGISGRLICGWLRSVRLHEVTIADVEVGLRQLRDRGLAACANELWYAREKAFTGGRYERQRPGTVSTCDIESAYPKQLSFTT
jgi:hypothetical protein